MRKSKIRHSRNFRKRFFFFKFRPLMLCVLILYMRGGTYSLMSRPNDRFLKSFAGNMLEYHAVV